MVKRDDYDPYDHDIGPKWLRDPKYILAVFLGAHLAICGWAFWELLT